MTDHNVVSVVHNDGIRPNSRHPRLYGLAQDWRRQASGGGRMRVRGWKLVGAIVVGTTMLTACTAASDATPSPTPTAAATSPEPSPSPTASEPPVAKPERPAEMDRTDEVGAAAAAEYFLSLYAYVMQTGDFAEWDAMSWETCGSCARVRESATAIAAAGDRYLGGAIIATRADVLEKDELIGGYPVDLTIRQEPSKRVNANGDVLSDNPAIGGSARVDALFESGRWVVLAFSSEAN
ncbi:DUF6318 family protein [Cellulomonas fimi]|uniref:DUF6318 domain-containing protein n=1 Tax=Cellulomonas fimi TaxID=1708 RepID=A0A7Y0QG99_CELFI|nr:DUF6318 family protein [Cellulomonas fimi]NMR19005.1 hypothetical protein [Cellulomonas fimi]